MYRMVLWAFLKAVEKESGSILNGKCNSHGSPSALLLDGAWGV